MSAENNSKKVLDTLKQYLEFFIKSDLPYKRFKKIPMDSTLLEEYIQELKCYKKSIIRREELRDLLQTIRLLEQGKPLFCYRTLNGKSDDNCFQVKK